MSAFNIELNSILYSITGVAFVFAAHFTLIKDADYITMSILFSIMALFIVIVSCSVRHRIKIMSAAIAAIATYACIAAATGAVYGI
jgi:VIT1/CCC1 family predicted Fe2+/Mn2+ transporter